MLQTIFTAFRAAGAACLLAIVVANPASARTFQETKIELNLATNEFDASVTIDGQTFPIQTPTQIVDGVFAKLDLSIALPNPSVAEQVKRRLETGFTEEPSGCRAGNYGPLDMEDGLRYFFEVQTQDGAVLASIYPGNRTDHWANDAFCEYSDQLGQGGAVVRLTGYYFVIYRQVESAQYIQLRAVTLTPSETDALTAPTGQ